MVNNVAPEEAVDQIGDSENVPDIEENVSDKKESVSEKKETVPEEKENVPDKEENVAKKSGRTPRGHPSRAPRGAEHPTTNDLDTVTNAVSNGASWGVETLPLELLSNSNSDCFCISYIETDRRTS